MIGSISIFLRLLEMHVFRWINRLILLIALPVNLAVGDGLAWSELLWNTNAWPASTTSPRKNVGSVHYWTNRASVVQSTNGFFKTDSMIQNAIASDAWAVDLMNGARERGWMLGLEFTIYTNNPGNYFPVPRFSRYEYENATNLKNWLYHNCTNFVALPLGASGSYMNDALTNGVGGIPYWTQAAILASNGLPQDFWTNTPTRDLGGNTEYGWDAIRLVLRSCRYVVKHPYIYYNRSKATEWTTEQDGGCEKSAPEGAGFWITNGFDFVNAACANPIFSEEEYGFSDSDILASKTDFEGRRSYALFADDPGWAYAAAALNGGFKTRGRAAVSLVGEYTERLLGIGVEYSMLTYFGFEPSYTDPQYMVALNWSNLPPEVCSGFASNAPYSYTFFDADSSYNTNGYWVSEKWMEKYWTEAFSCCELISDTDYWAYLWTLDSSFHTLYDNPWNTALWDTIFEECWPKNLVMEGDTSTGIKVMFSVSETLDPAAIVLFGIDYRYD